VTRSLVAGLACICAALSALAAEWQLATVPGATNISGLAWYRTWVKVPDSFFAQHERNLFEESVGVGIRDLAGAHEVWLNGKQIGRGNADQQFHRHKVPVGALRKTAWNELAIHLNGTNSTIGFTGEAPFIMDYFLECVLEGQWEFCPGSDYIPGGALTNRPARATFDRFRESSRVLGRSKQVHGPKLSPQESAAKLRPGADFIAELLLSEPLVAQPAHFSFDERGRLWVSQYRQYPYPAGLTMLSRDKYYRAHYDKIPPAPPNHDRGADIISIHEDTDGDGVFDRQRVGVDERNAVVPIVGHDDGR